MTDNDLKRHLGLVKTLELSNPAAVDTVKRDLFLHFLNVNERMRQESAQLEMMKERRYAAGGVPIVQN